MTEKRMNYRSKCAPIVAAVSRTRGTFNQRVMGSSSIALTREIKHLDVVTLKISGGWGPRRAQRDLRAPAMAWSGAAVTDNVISEAEAKAGKPGRRSRFATRLDIGEQLFRIHRRIPLLFARAQHLPWRRFSSRVNDGCSSRSHRAGAERVVLRPKRASPNRDACRFS